MKRKKKKRVQNSGSVLRWLGQNGSDPRDEGHCKGGPWWLTDDWEMRKCSKKIEWRTPLSL